MNKLITFTNFFLIKFFACFLLKELSIIKKKIGYLKFFFNEISLSRYAVYLFNKDFIPLWVKKHGSEKPIVFRAIMSGLSETTSPDLRK